MRRRRCILAATLFLAVLFSACLQGEQSGRPESRAATETPAINPEERAPRYLVKFSGNGPFYFELSPGGPRLIPSPAEASLVPFVPWTQSVHISHILPQTRDREEVLYAAVNRGGILECTDSGGETAVYYTPGGESWEQYPLAAFFRYNQKPAALLARDRFFSVEEQLPPPAAVWAMLLVSEHPSIAAENVPALAWDASSLWESAGLFWGRDGSWYIRKINAENKSAYFRGADLSRPGEVIDAERFLKAAVPLESGDPSVPPLLAGVLNEAARLAGKPCTASVVSSAFPAKRLFGGGAALADQFAGTNAAPPNSFALANNENAEELSGYYRPPEQGGEEAALVLFPDGRGLYGFSLGGEVESGRFDLPALPPGNFAYTGIALVGTRGASTEASGFVLFASWEEQENWNVGAAGFALLEIGR